MLGIEPNAALVAPFSPGAPELPEPPEPDPEPDPLPTGVLVGPVPGLSRTIEPPVGTKGISGAEPALPVAAGPVVDGQMISYVVLV